jgi:hypothetical protein
MHASSRRCPKLGQLKAMICPCYSSCPTRTCSLKGCILQHSMHSASQPQLKQSDEDCRRCSLQFQTTKMQNQDVNADMQWPCIVSAPSAAHCMHPGQHSVLIPCRCLPQNLGCGRSATSRWRALSPLTSPRSIRTKCSSTAPNTPTAMNDADHQTLQCAKFAPQHHPSSFKPASTLSAAELPPAPPPTQPPYPPLPTFRQTRP